MEKSQFSNESTPATAAVMPRTLVITPMEYAKPDGSFIYFSGVFGSDVDSIGSDVWVATFYDRNEAEAYILGCKAFGNPVGGVRLSLKLAGETNGARVCGSPETSDGG